MNPKCIYEVKTHWGWFRLDEGAYEDYLRGKLWISRTPGKAPEVRMPEAKPVHVSEKAEYLYSQSEKRGLWTALQTEFAGRTIRLPYRARMSETDIGEMNLSVRSSNGLMRAGVKNLGRLAECIVLPAGLRSIRNLGIKSEKEIMRCFFELCYSKLNHREKLEYWQSVIDEGDTARQNVPDIVPY